MSAGQALPSMNSMYATSSLQQLALPFCLVEVPLTSAVPNILVFLMTHLRMLLQLVMIAVWLVRTAMEKL